MCAMWKPVHLKITAAQSQGGMEHLLCAGPYTIHFRYIISLNSYTN